MSELNEPIRWERPRDAAKRCQISIDLIRQAVKGGDLQAYPVGRGTREYRLDPAEVDAWMKSRAWEPRAVAQ